MYVHRRLYASIEPLDYRDRSLLVRHLIREILISIIRVDRAISRGLRQYLHGKRDSDQIFRPLRLYVDLFPRRILSQRKAVNSERDRSSGA